MKSQCIKTTLTALLALTGMVGIGNASAYAASISGSWSSNLGQARFQQSGSDVRGTLQLRNGTNASIKGRVQNGSRFTFSWGVGGTKMGDGSLRFRNGSWSGSIRSRSRNAPVSLTLQPRFATTDPLGGAGDGTGGFDPLAGADGEVGGGSSGQDDFSNPPGSSGTNFDDNPGDLGNGGQDDFGDNDDEDFRDFDDNDDDNFRDFDEDRRGSGSDDRRDRDRNRRCSDRFRDRCPNDYPRVRHPQIPSHPWNEHGRWSHYHHGGHFGY